MTEPNYLLIAYDADKLKNVSDARHKSLSKNEFQLLQEDYVREIELEEVKYEIIEKRFAGIQFFIRQVTYLVIIDIKRKN